MRTGLDKSGNRRFAGILTMLALACALVCAVLLAGCGSDSIYAGRWECVSVSDGTTTYVVEDLGLDGADLMTLTLSGDGSVSMTSMGESVDTTGLTWGETDDGIEIMSSTGAMQATYDSSTEQLTLDYDGQTVVLAK